MQSVELLGRRDELRR